MVPFHHHHHCQKEKYAHADMQTVKFFVAINAHRHTNALRLVQIETKMEWSQFWGWASQQAYVTRAQWTLFSFEIAN